MKISQKKKAKIQKLKKLYDLNKPADLFTIVPQEMEVMEAKGLASKLDGAARKKDVIETILGIAEDNGIKLNEETLSVFIDVINAASKGKYALNKDQS